MQGQLPGTFELGTFAEINDGDWFMDPASDGYYLAIRTGQTEDTVANPQRSISVSRGAIDDVVFPLNFPAQATAGIYRTA